MENAKIVSEALIVHFIHCIALVFYPVILLSVPSLCTLRLITLCPQIAVQSLSHLNCVLCSLDPDTDATLLSSKARAYSKESLGLANIFGSKHRNQSKLCETQFATYLCALMFVSFGLGLAHEAGCF